MTPNGVERLEKVRIGGIDQWVSIRGADRRNPVLLYIHGGPGYVSIPMSWWFSRGWRFAKVEAPAKHLVWFEHSAHLPMTEEPGKFLVSLVRYARPIADRAGDIAPDARA